MNSSMCEIKLDIAKKELKECYDSMRMCADSIVELQQAVTSLNNARHDGPITGIISAYNNAFSACENAGKTLLVLNTKISSENDIWKKL